FLPVAVLSRLFRRLFLEYLLKAFDAGKLEFFSSLEPLKDRHAFLRHLAPTRETEWVVYAKRPFAGPEQVLDYVGRYTHRVALSNNRLLDIGQDKVTFRYKDYRHDSQQKTMTLDAEEFIRRFLLHVLPEGFQRIATTASWPTDTESRNWRTVESFWTCRRRNPRPSKSNPSLNKRAKIAGAINPQ